ncbi:MAG: B12-binding domain-containing radical SAM protein [Nitrospirota bacterium]
MPKKILLITPPFTQLNTPYPATPYLKGFLTLHGHGVFQADLGIELIDRIFCRRGFQELFGAIKKDNKRCSPNSREIIDREHYYLQTVDAVMSFLRCQDNTLAQLICSDDFLPRASRFDQLPDLEWSFGQSGVNDKARFFATLYIEDMGDLIRDAIAPHFGFSRYAEKLGMSAHDFGPIDAALRQPENIIEIWMLELLEAHLVRQRPDVVGMTIPFPGNLYAGLKCGQFIKANRPAVKIVAGGGFVNTELRELSEPAVFDYVDFITLDDGELPFVKILGYLDGKTGTEGLTRTFMRTDQAVVYVHDDKSRDPSPAETGCPDYSDLPLDKYVSLIEVANPMHRLWSEGRWNKLTLAHGCYWHKCSFCDTSLDYIKRYEAVPVSVLVDQIEQLIARTGQRGFHFVDEAAPPAVLKGLALELLRRGIAIAWWTNIRLEAAFTPDLCRLLAASGCIAASGGLETASDRLLTLMNKGVTIRQAAQACRNLTETGIMVHAYLMYGFPTETAQETVDSLEIVRQFFHEGLIQSAFWHLFTATVHSDVGSHPWKYQCTIPIRPSGRFAKNDLVHKDPFGADPQVFAPGLNKAVYNFMHGIGTDFPVREWFDIPVPALSVKKNAVKQAIKEGPAGDEGRMRSRALWIGGTADIHATVSEGKKRSQGSSLFIHGKSGTIEISVSAERAAWLGGMLERCSLQAPEAVSLADLERDFEKHYSPAFGPFLTSPEWKILRENGLLLL